MKSLFISFLVVFSLALGPAAVCQSAPATLDLKADGTVAFGGQVYNSLTEYYQSDEFRFNGRRCGTRIPAALKEAAASPQAGPGDCTLGRTVIDGAYYPNSAHAIPIVFHVISKSDGTGDIPDSRILHQVDALNEDYRALAGSMGAAGYDSHIQFELAGITRTVNDTWYADGNEYAYKTALGWNQDKYLNIYVNSASGYLGYAYLPQDSAGTVVDGVVVLHEACGGRDEGTFPYNQGRTLTHEVGHYLGLLHTFEGGCETGYMGGDLIEDTNPELEAHYACIDVNTCGAPAPIRNYMNYTDDACMEEFTPEQSNRAVCSLVNYRPTLYHLDAGSREKKIFVKNITMTLVPGAGGKSAAKGAVLIKDEAGNPVPNVIVSIRWGGLVDGTAFKKTNTNGKAVFTSDETASSGRFTLTVTNAYRSNKRYMRSMNVLTSKGVNK